MVEALANRIGAYLVSVRAADEDDLEVISYGIFHILAGIQQIVILVVVALMMKMVPEIFLYSICFTSLKRYIGGFHAGSHWACIAGYTFITAAACYGCGMIPIGFAPALTIFFSVSAFLLVLIKAPVPHYNRPLSAKKRNRMRKASVISASLQLLAVMIGCLLAVGRFSHNLPTVVTEQAGLYILCGSAGGLSAAIMLIIPIPEANEGRCKNESETE